MAKRSRKQAAAGLSSAAVVLDAKPAKKIVFDDVSDVSDGEEEEEEEDVSMLAGEEDDEEGSDGDEDEEENDDDDDDDDDEAPEAVGVSNKQETSEAEKEMNE